MDEVRGKYKRTLEHRKRMSEIAKKNGNGGWMKGIKKELHPRWRGGLTTYMRKLFLNNRRRVMKICAEGYHSQGEWELLKKQYGYICPSCGKPEPSIVLTEDHIIPLSKGGSDYIENIQPLCKNCNCKKYTKTIKY